MTCNLTMADESRTEKTICLAVSSLRAFLSSSYGSSYSAESIRESNDFIPETEKVFIFNSKKFRSEIPCTD